MLPASVAAVLTYFPRLRFNAGFERLLLKYCERKHRSARGPTSCAVITFTE
jgi:hypothetical protein